ncbi:MotA/TolQ/ExbB proton channel family protein [Thalassobaculum sp.]|uniref:MotA/TolQ/ExbB proton channel family protein n=1 Tax=Thalassobaculum sp. TaxID=2022740 RepID=UPI003B5B1B4B
MSDPVGTTDPAAAGDVVTAAGGGLPVDGALTAGATEADWLTTLTDMLAAGGPVVAILLAMSVIALAIVLVKLWQFRSARLGDRASVRNALTLVRAGRPHDALAVVRSKRNPVAQAVARALIGHLRGLPDHKVREEAVRFGGDMLEELRGYLRPLEVIASLAPLLGLFGTVLGMIGAFQQLEAAGNQVNPAVLSGGIWEALLTTAVGLAVAIPAVAALNWLERAVERTAHEMDSAITGVFTQDLSTLLGESDGHGYEREFERGRGPARLRTAAAGE